VDKMQTLVEHLNPSKILERGFALIFSSEGDTISSTHQVAKDESLNIRLRDGTISVAAKTSHPGAKQEP